MSNYPQLPWQYTTIFLPFEIWQGDLIDSLRKNNRFHTVITGPLHVLQSNSTETYLTPEEYTYIQFVNGMCMLQPHILIEVPSGKHNINFPRKMIPYMASFEKYRKQHE